MKLITNLLTVGLLAVTGWQLAVAQVIYDPNFRYDGQPRPIEYFLKILPKGITKEKVVKIMGSPGYEYKNEWSFRNKVLNPTTGNVSSLEVKFNYKWEVVEVSNR